MNHFRRSILKGAAGTSIVAVAVAAGLVAPTRVLAATPRSAFESKGMAEAMKSLGISAPADSREIAIKVPDIAENGSVVPVEITSKIDGTSSIAIFAEKNATPLVATFSLTGGAAGFVSTRIKMASTALVRAVVTANGKTYTAAREVKVTIGGCGG